MKATTQKILLISGSLAVAGSISFIIYRRIRNANMIDNILNQLNSGTGQYGDLKDIPGFKGTAYRNGLSSSLNIIKLKDEVAREYAEKIENAWGKFNDDEAAIYAVFRSIKDNYALSQVASVYEALKYGNLLNTLEEKLSTDEQNEIYKIVRLYKPYRIAS